MEKKEINQEAVELLTPRGFDRAFFRQLGAEGVETHRQAWERVEAVFVEYFGRRKYKNFESFQMSKNRRMKK